jgi:hypothetical protein
LDSVAAFLIALSVKLTGISRLHPERAGLQWGFTEAELPGDTLDHSEITLRYRI